MKNALTIDVEDYFHVSAFADSITPESWSERECRVEKNTYKLLEIFDDAGYKATFFILGWVAENYPGLLKDIQQQGHEIASHGYSHQLVYNQTREMFKKETLKSKQLIEDIIGWEVIGYRAASYSITKDSLWALDVLAEAGFKYDSSIFPVRHDRYGIPDAEVAPHRLITPSGMTLAEFPLTTLRLPGFRLPMAGGGYFPLFPFFVFYNAARYINKIQKQPLIFYLHPWEIDIDQPKIDASWFSRFRHYNNVDNCEERLVRFLSHFEFTTTKSVLTETGLLAA